MWQLIRLNHSHCVLYEQNPKFTPLCLNPSSATNRDGGGSTKGGLKRLVSFSSLWPCSPICLYRSMSPSSPLPTFSCPMSSSPLRGGSPTPLAPDQLSSIEDERDIVFYSGIWCDLEQAEVSFSYVCLLMKSNGSLTVNRINKNQSAASPIVVH